jgi:ATP-dependent Clp protease, protease subunit
MRPENRNQAVQLLERTKNYVPYPSIVESTHRGERSWDVFSRLLHDRIVFLGSEINDDVCNIVIAQLLFLDSEDSEKDIQIYINSPGGVITSGLAIYDTMQWIRADVSTICIGQAASMGAVLLAAGKKGKRYSLPNSRIMIHQPSGGVRGQATDIEIQAKEIRRFKEILTSILFDATGKPKEDLLRDMERDYYMSASEAKEYGIVDEIFVRQA